MTNWRTIYEKINYKQHFNPNFKFLSIFAIFVFATVCSVLQQQEASFSSYENIEGFSYNQTLRGDLTLLAPKDMDLILSTSDRTGPNRERYNTLFRNFITKQIRTTFKTSVNIDDHLPSLRMQILPEVRKSFSQDITEPPLSLAQLQKISQCPLPSINLDVDNTDRAITSNVEWRMFVTCELKSWERISSNNQAVGNPSIRVYSPIAASTHYTNVLEFTAASVLRMFKEYYHANLSLNAQLGMFERIFLVTKFRALTQAERNVAEDLIFDHGLLLLRKTIF